MDKQLIHYLNGKFVREDELLISPRDLGFARGYAVFDFLKTYPHHRPFMLDRHIDRLLNSVKLVNLTIPWSKEELREIIKNTLDQNKTNFEKFIKISLTGGISGNLIPAEKPTIIVQIDPAFIYPDWYYQKGIGVTTVKFTRYLQAAKTNNYIEGVRQTQLGQKIDAIEPIYYDDTQVFEAATCSIFAVIDNQLMTTKSNILRGITREVLLEILKLEIPVIENDFTIDQLRNATEVFITASGKEICPVTKMDNKPVGNGEVGPLTKEVMKQFHEYTTSDKW